jgi:hypothetical protein
MEKQYVGHGKVVTTQFGEIIKMSLREEDLKILQENLSNGWVNFDILKRKAPSEKGMTHYGVIDNWKPNQGKNATAQESRPVSKNAEESTADDLPF